MSSATTSAGGKKKKRSNRKKKSEGVEGEGLGGGGMAQSDAADLEEKPTEPDREITATGKEDDILTGEGDKAILDPVSSQNEESDIDDDDVPSELLPVQWRNPSLDVETEILAPPDILEVINPLSTQDCEAPQPSAESEQFFQNPFCPPPPIVDDPSPSDEINSLRRESIKYTSAWESMAPELSDEETPVRVPTPLQQEDTEIPIQQNISKVNEGGNTIIPLDQWVKETLKGISSLYGAEILQIFQVLSMRRSLP